MQILHTLPVTVASEELLIDEIRMICSIALCFVSLPRCGFRSTHFFRWRNFCSSASLTFPLRAAAAVPGPHPLALPLPPSRLDESDRLPLLLPLVLLLLWVCFLLCRTPTSMRGSAVPGRNRRSAAPESLCHRISVVNRCMARKDDDVLRR